MDMYFARKSLLLVTVFFLVVGCTDDTAEITPSTSPGASKYIPVTAENYVQAETDWNFAAQQAKAPINTWIHNGESDNHPFERRCCVLSCAC